MLTLPPLPPALEAPLPDFSLKAFVASRIHPGSDPQLVAALRRLYLDSPSFRTLLQDFSREQPLVALLLVPMLDRSPGGLIVRPVSDSFLVTVRVQVRLAQSGTDAAEPWLGCILHGLLAVSRAGGVRSLNRVQFVFGHDVQKNMVYYQHVLRRELAAAATEPKLTLPWNWETLYVRFVLGRVTPQC